MNNYIIKTLQIYIGCHLSYYLRQVFKMKFIIIKKSGLQNTIYDRLHNKTSCFIQITNS